MGQIYDKSADRKSLNPFLKYDPEDWPDRILQFSLKSRSDEKIISIQVMVSPTAVRKKKI